MHIQETQFKVDICRVTMKSFRVTMFCVILLIAHWKLDFIIAEQFPNSILIMSNTDQFFPDIIHSGEFALFLYIRFLNVPMHELQRHT
jgi:hypothetical protein